MSNLDKVTDSSTKASSHLAERVDILIQEAEKIMRK